MRPPAVTQPNMLVDTAAGSVGTDMRMCMTGEFMIGDHSAGEGTCFQEGYEPSPSRQGPVVACMPWTEPTCHPMDFIDRLLVMVWSGDSLVRSTAVHTLRMLALHSLTNCLVIQARNGIAALVMLVRDGHRDNRGSAAALLLVLMSYSPTAWSAIQAAGGIAALIALLRDGSYHDQLRAMGVLLALGSRGRGDSCIHINSAGGTAVLCTLLYDNSGVLRQASGMLLYVMCQHVPDILVRTHVIQLLTEMARRGHQEATMNAAVVLASLPGNIRA